MLFAVNQEGTRLSTWRGGDNRLDSEFHRSNRLSGTGYLALGIPSILALYWAILRQKWSLF